MTSAAFPSLRRLAHVLGAAFALAPLAAGATAVEDLVARQWIQVESMNFRIVSDQPEATARAMVLDLEHLRYISNRVRGTESLPGPPLTIVAMGKRGFATLGLPDCWAGVFQLSRLGYAALGGIEDYAKTGETGNFARSTILHEYHHFLLRYGAETVALPRWYDEGMSEYWSSLTIEDGKAWFGHPIEGSGREYYLQTRSGSTSFDTKELFAITKLRYDDTGGAEEDLRRFYARSRYAIHYFQSTRELRRQLDKYLRLLNMGLSQDQAVRLAFKQTYEELDNEMRRYVDHKVIVRGFSIGKDALDLPQVPMKVTPLDHAATYAALAEIVPRFTERGSAVTRELVETNLTLHPGDSNAYALAFTFLDQTHADGRLDALLERHPDDSLLLTLRGDHLAYGALSRRATGGSDWLPQLRQARELYRKAIHADSTNARAYVGMAFAYTALPDGEPLQEGIDCLEMAVIYERRASLFHAMADLDLRTKKVPEALRSLRSSVAFGADASLPFDALLMENLELVIDAGTGTPTATGLAFKSGATYEGPLVDGKPEGHGKWLRPTGSYYEGDFAAGLPAGQGKLVSERGAVYEGGFANGIAHGQGRVHFAPSSSFVSYEGAIDNAMPSGRGVLVTKDGRLEAPFVKGQAHGSGAFTPAHGREPLTGQWYFGQYDWPAADGIAFTGGIDAEGQRHGVGLCRASAANDISECRFSHGRNVPTHRNDADDED